MYDNPILKNKLFYTNDLVPNSTCRSEHHVISMKMNSLGIYFLCSRQIMSKLHAEVLFWYPGETRANTTAN